MWKQHKCNEQFKRGGEFSGPWLGFYNRFHILANNIMQAGIPGWEEPEKDRRTILREEKVKKKKKVKKKIGNIRKAERKLLREVTVKIGLERINA